MSERILSVGGNKASRPIEDFMIGIIGTEYYVGPNAVGAGDDGRSGRSKETSLATLEAAITKATASKNDIIYLLPGHTETVATAGAISLDKIGLRVIGLGTGALRPTFTFSATAATITITAASCELKNIIVKPSIDNVVSPIVVSAADCKVDYECQEESAIVQCTSAFLTTAGADRLDLKLKHRGFIASAGCVNAIRLVGVDTARIDVDFYGVASTAIVEFHTTACHDISINGKFYNDGTSLTKNVFDTATGSTWSASGWDGNSQSNFSGGDGVALAGDDVGVVSAAVAVIDGLHDVPTADAATNLYMRDVVGIKTDAAVGAATTDKSLMGYVKGIVTDTAVIGALGVGLTGLGGMSAGMKAEVNTEVDGALNTAVPLTPTANSLNDTLSKLDGANTFDNTTDSLEAIRDVIDTNNTADQVDLDAILADTTTIGDATLPVAPVAGSLARFVASGGTALGVQLPDSKSLYDMVRQYGEGYVATKQSAITAAGTVTLFTVTGEVEVIIAGYIDVAMTGTTGLLEVGIAGATAGLIAQATQAALLINLLWVAATPATLVARPTAKIIANGAAIIQTAGGTVTASTVTYYCYWRPLSADGNVVAA